MPSYVVRKEEEELIRFNPDSPMADDGHPMRPKPESAVPVEPEGEAPGAEPPVEAPAEEPSPEPASEGNEGGEKK